MPSVIPKEEELEATSSQKKSEGDVKSVPEIVPDQFHEPVYRRYTRPPGNVTPAESDRDLFPYAPEGARGFDSVPNEAIIGGTNAVQATGGVSQTSNRPVAQYREPEVEPSQTSSSQSAGQSSGQSAPKAATPPANAVDGIRREKLPNPSNPNKGNQPEKMGLIAQPMGSGGATNTAVGGGFAGGVNRIKDYAVNRFKGLKGAQPGGENPSEQNTSKVQKAKALGDKAVKAGKFVADTSSNIARAAAGDFTGIAIQLGKIGISFANKHWREIGICILLMVFGVILLLQSLGGNSGGGLALPSQYSVASLQDSDLPRVFNPNNIMSDALFTNKDAMSEADIEKFLKDKNSPLLTVDPSQFGRREDSESAETRTVAQIIYAATRYKWPGQTEAVSINPMVILATLQKETSMITKAGDSSDYQRALDGAMGFSRSNDLHKGFTREVYYGAKSLWDCYNHPESQGYPLNSRDKLVNVWKSADSHYGITGPYPGDRVTISNRATGAFYGYTPHYQNPFYPDDPTKLTGNKNLWTIMDKWFRGNINTMTCNSNIKPPPGAHFACGVPEVKQGRSGQCGTASALMVILSRNMGFFGHSNLFGTGEVVTKEGDHFVSNPNISVNNQVTMTKVGTSLSGWIKVFTKEGEQWAQVGHSQFSSQDKFVQSVKSSIDNNTPILIYLHELIYSSDPGHIVVIVGYDDQTFFINDPQNQGDKLFSYTNINPNPSKPKLTFENFWGDPGYHGGASYVIMKKAYIAN